MDAPSLKKPNCVQICRRYRQLAATGPKTASRFVAPSLSPGEQCGL